MNRTAPSSPTASSTRVSSLTGPTRTSPSPHLSSNACMRAMSGAITYPIVLGEPLVPQVETPLPQPDRWSRSRACRRHRRACASTVVGHPFLPDARDRSCRSSSKHILLLGCRQHNSPVPRYFLFFLVGPRILSNENVDSLPPSSPSSILVVSPRGPDRVTGQWQCSLLVHPKGSVHS